MPRPKKFDEPMMTYNLTLPVSDYDIIRQNAHNRSIVESRQVSVAEVLRSYVKHGIWFERNGD